MGFFDRFRKKKEPKQEESIEESANRYMEEHNRRLEELDQALKPRKGEDYRKSLQRLDEILSDDDRRMDEMIQEEKRKLRLAEERRRQEYNNLSGRLNQLNRAPGESIANHMAHEQALKFAAEMKAKRKDDEER